MAWRHPSPLVDALKLLVIARVLLGASLRSLNALVGYIANFRQGAKTKKVAVNQKSHRTRWLKYSFSLVGDTGFEPVTSSV